MSIRRCLTIVALGLAAAMPAAAADSRPAPPALEALAGVDLPTLMALALPATAAATDAASAVDGTLPRARQMPATLRIKRVATGPDGKSRLDVIELPIVHSAPGESILSRLFATDVELGYGAPGSFIDWHRVTTPRLWVLLQGAFEFGTGDGQVHRLGAGDIVLAADTTGQGHTSRNVGDLPAFVLTIRLPAADSLRPKTAAPPVPKPE
jgi:hypothetical protein